MEQLRDNEPRVIFVTGGPGTGKGTQCPKLVEEFGYKHISIGDLVRAEIRSGSEEGKNIQSIVQSGGLVPKELTVTLLQKSLMSIQAHTVLVDGFPRSVEQAIYLEQIGFKVNFLLHFDTDKEDVLLNRLIERGKTSGRADDNEETIVKRFRVYKAESLPVLQLYEPFGIVRKVDCMGTINEVFFRTLCAIRPELLFVAGSKFSGKSTLSMSLGSKYYYYILDINRVIKKSNKTDEDITRKLVKTLQGFKHQHRVLVDGFPQNAHQAKLFTGLLGLPNKVLYLGCSPDECQERQLSQGKSSENYITSTNLSRLYSESISSYSELCGYYSATLSKNFCKIESQSIESIRKEAERFIEPQVVIVRGNVRPCFLLKFKAQGFALINGVHVLELWRNARGLSASENQLHLHDDAELIEIFKDIIFSGTAQGKFLIYNFALFNANLISEFQAKICRISQVFQLFSGADVPFDKVASYFYPRKGFFFVNTSGISYKRVLLPDDVTKIENDLESQTAPIRSSVIVLLGPTLTGKTKATHALIECGMRIIDFLAIVEETKQRLSTEDEPKEDLTFTEIIEGVKFEASKNPQQILVIDGLPPTEVLFAKDPLYPLPDLPEEKGEDDFPYDEDPSIQEKASAVSKRLRILVSSLNVLSYIHFKVPFKVLETRARKKFEVPEEEDLNNEQRSQIFESWMIGQLLYAKPKPDKYNIPEIISLNTEKLSFSQISTRLKNIFKRKCILVESNNIGTLESVKKMTWKNQIPFIDMSILMSESSLDKFEALKQRCRSIPPRARYVALSGFPFQLNEYQSILKEFGFIEDYIGRPHIFFVFTDKPHDTEIPELSPAPRKNESHSAMWNNSKSSSQYKIFHNYKGNTSEVLSKLISLNNYSEVFDELLDAVDNERRLLYQFIIDENTARGYLSYLNDRGIVSCKDFKEKLFLDTSGLDSKKKIQSALKNPRAKDFHMRYLKVYTVPFCLFFNSFSEIIKLEDIEITPGLRKSIRESIDANKNYFIDAEEVNMFFDSWENKDEKDMILSRAIANDRKSESNQLSYNLIFLVESASVDPVTRCQSFNRGDIFEITHEGYRASKRFCADKTVYFGKENPNFTNDIEFNSADTRISISHFQIHSKKSGYYIVDNSSENNLLLKVFEIPVTLFEDCLICIGEHQIRVTELSNPNPSEDSAISLKFIGRQSNVENDPQIELEFISEMLFGVKFSSQGKRLLKIGSSPTNDIVVPGISPYHCTIELRLSGWCLSDNHTVQGTSISINTFSNIKYKKPSSSLKLLNGMRFEVPGLSFRLLHKSTAKVYIDVNDFNEFRYEKFLDFYSVVRHLGKSLVGEKYLCRHLQSRRYYLAKMIEIKNLDDNLRTEIGILRQLDHPNTVKVVDTLVDGVKIYVISEICEGPELFERIVAKGTHNEDTACKYIRQVLQGVAYLHENHICHRDIRPENLQFAEASEESLLKICDFGNAIDNKGFVDKVVGSGHYLAPEVFNGQYSKAADVWACGAVLYAMLVGVPPFTGKTDADVRKKAMKGIAGFKEKAWAKISNHAKRVVRLMLTLDATKRPSASELLSDPWIKQSLKFLDISKPMIARTFKNFKSFYSSNKLQQAIYFYMSQNLNNEQLKKQAADLFVSLDKNSDGKVSSQELLQGLEENGIAFSENELKTSLSEVDANNNGWIDFSEFLVVFASKMQVISKENLERTFAIFDADGSGEITTAELKRILGQTESEWSQTIKEIDENKDGKIDMKEFKNLLLRFGQ